MNVAQLQFALVIGVALLTSGCQESRKANRDTDNDGEHRHKSRGAHSHGHQPGKAPHGGRLVSIGHRHHEKGETYYYAEVMPVAEGRISFHLLVAAPGGKLTNDSYDGSIEAIINRPGGGSTGAQSVRFDATKTVDGDSSFSANIPERFTDARKLLVVVPKIRLGGERFTFSFRVDVEPAQPSSRPRKSGKKTGQSS